MPIAVPFFIGSKQFSIELAEPVVLLRGPPTDPTTHVLRGEVELVLSKPIAASQVLVKLIGKSKMLWPEGMGPRGTKVCHEKTILEQNIILDRRPEDNANIPAGLHRWPFEFLIPNSMVETIEDELAQVYYYVSAMVQRPGISTPNLRCRRNILLLRTLSWSDDVIASHALPNTSIVAERKTEACDATFYIEKNIVSSGTQFPISIVLMTQMKNVSLESIQITLTEKRLYQVPEFDAKRAELHDFRLQLASVSNMADTEQMRQVMIPSSDLPLHEIRQLLASKNAHIPLGTAPFQYRFMFTLPNCLTLNHTTYIKEMNFLHYLKLDIELSVQSGHDNTIERPHIHFESPITILDCRLKDDFTTLPTYQEALCDQTIDVNDEQDVLNQQKTGFFICPCYVDYKKKSTKFNKRERMMILQHTSSDSLGSPSSSHTSSRRSSIENSTLPPPPYDK
ncbi:hypothetical protein BD560DRAFT_403988 [Blakeslea trispora]|nr:hypothetical protein BD560DRAFT_403988 [Blakeslea trispora]